MFSRIHAVYYSFPLWLFSTLVIFALEKLKYKVFDASSLVFFPLTLCISLAPPSEEYRFIRRALNVVVL